MIDIFAKKRIDLPKNIAVKKRRGNRLAEGFG